VNEIPADRMALDIGVATIQHFSQFLQDAKLIIWNGPMGVFEFEKFAMGSNALATLLAGLADDGAEVIIGGGDSAAAVSNAGLTARMSHVSTGGGASLELLEGKNLPGIAALDDK
ncbi:MAG: phosphoglycerate kinase, partial [Anaerolineales bacterium]|nr:phosphoglycerate kinase [Anaerolineales bacterium]